LLLDHDWVGVRNALRHSLRLAGKVNRCAWSEEVQRDIEEHERLPGRTIDSCKWSPLQVRAKAEKQCGYQRITSNLKRSDMFSTDLHMLYTDNDVLLCDNGVRAAIDLLPADHAHKANFYLHLQPYDADLRAAIEARDLAALQALRVRI
jgi:hypothetical protein